ncbi:MAG: ABC transporter permease, partial [Promethearchaeota archaeon]
AAYVGPRAFWQMRPGQIEALRKRLGLDQPWYLRYIKHTLRMFEGDWGYSASNRGEPVLRLLYSRFPATAELAIVAMVIAIFVGIPLGIKSAVDRNKTSDHIIRVGMLTAYSIPVYVLGLIMQLVYFQISVRMGLQFNMREIAYFLPTSRRFNPVIARPPNSIFFGLLQPTGFLSIDSILSFDPLLFLDAFLHLLAPATVLGVSLIAIIARMTRMAMVEVMRADYILLARAKGLNERIIVYRHALRNALLPVLTIGGIILANLLTGAIYVELIFNWPGIGHLVTDSVLILDMPVIHGFCVLAATIYVTINLVVDLAYAWLDPRIRV